MRPWEYVRPEGVAEAIATYTACPDAQYLGGGTNLIDLMRLGVATPGTLIDVSRLPLDHVDELPDGGLRVGATVRNSDLAAHPLVRARYPVLSAALLAGASGQLRNTATTGGNLLQRTRCPYFQDPSKPCNKRDPGAGCAALAGVQRDHAVLGHSAHCIATHPSDLAVALTALDAGAEVTGPDGDRTVPVAELYRLPGDRPDLDTVLTPGELITGVVLPAGAVGLPSAYRKVRDRASYAFALASVAAVLEPGPGRTVRRVGIAFGGMAHQPWRARTAEDLLSGTVLTGDRVRRAVEAELAAARPLSGNAYKIGMARNLAEEVLSGLVGEAVPGPAAPV